MIEDRVELKEKIFNFSDKEYSEETIAKIINMLELFNRKEFYQKFNEILNELTDRILWRYDFVTLSNLIIVLFHNGKKSEILLDA